LLAADGGSFAGRNRSGVAMKSLPGESLERELIAGSAFEKAFEMQLQCTTAEGHK